MAAEVVKVGLVQHACGEDREDNFRRAEAGIREARARGAQLVCLQELFGGVYFCQSCEHKYFSWAEPVPGPSTERLGRLARELEVGIIASLFERRAPGLYHNTAAILAPDGRLAGKYRKMHIPDDPLFYEKFYFTPGDLGFAAWDVAGVRAGVLVCWDQWFPEAARLTALCGAHILFYPTAIGWHPSEKAEYGQRQHASWELIQRAHAVANGCFVAVVNRVGREAPAGGDGLEFWGQSFVCGPDGAILAKASAEREEVLVAELDLRAIERQRTHWPFLRDRRVDAYEGILRRFGDA